MEANNKRTISIYVLCVCTWTYPILAVKDAELQNNLSQQRILKRMNKYNIILLKMCLITFECDYGYMNLSILHSISTLLQCTEALC